MGPGPLGDPKRPGPCQLAMAQEPRLVLEWCERRCERLVLNLDLVARIMPCLAQHCAASKYAGTYSE